MSASALVMGAAVCGMHYTGMKAASFYDNDGQLPDGYADGLRCGRSRADYLCHRDNLLVLMLVLYYWRQRYRSSLSI